MSAPNHRLLLFFQLVFPSHTLWPRARVDLLRYGARLRKRGKNNLASIHNRNVNSMVKFNSQNVLPRVTAWCYFQYQLITLNNY